MFRKRLIIIFLVQIDHMLHRSNFWDPLEVRTPTNGKSAPKCPFFSPSVNPTLGKGGAARLFILFYFHCSADHEHNAQMFLRDPEAVLFAGLFLEVWTS